MTDRRRKPRRRRSDPGLWAGLLAASAVGVLWLFSSLPGREEAAAPEPAAAPAPEPARVRHIGPEDNEFDGEVRRGGGVGAPEAPLELAAREEWQEALRIGGEAYDSIVAAVERHAAGNADTYRADMDDARRRLEEALDLLRPLQEEYPPGTPARDALEHVTQRFLRLARDAAKL